jgi:hypothetical protein
MICVRSRELIVDQVPLTSPFAVREPLGVGTVFVERPFYRTVFYETTHPEWPDFTIVIPWRQPLISEEGESLTYQQYLDAHVWQLAVLAYREGQPRTLCMEFPWV